MMIRKLSLIELNIAVTHMLKHDVTIRGDEISVLVDDLKGNETRISARMVDGVVVDINYDLDHTHVDAIDEFRDYLGELEEVYVEMMNILDPMPDNDNKG